MIERDNYKEKTFTTSKIYVMITGGIFILVLLFVMYLYLSHKIDNTFDAAAIVTMITVTGSIFGSNLVWYSKKAASENHYKLRMALYRDASVTRLEFNEAMLKLKKEYEATNEDIEEIESQGDMDEMMDSALSSVIEDLNNTRDTCDAENTIDQL